MTSTRRAFVVGLTLAGMSAAVAGCSGSREDRPRCAQCGMYADDAPQWAARARERSGATLHFDSPKCLLRYAAAADASRALALTVTEYYTQTARPADAVLYVRGSDLRSPMGADLVPVEGREAAEAFARDHGGDVLTLGEITPAVLARLE